MTSQPEKKMKLAQKAPETAQHGFGSIGKASPVLWERVDGRQILSSKATLPREHQAKSCVERRIRRSKGEIPVQARFRHNSGGYPERSRRTDPNSPFRNS